MTAPSLESGLRGLPPGLCDRAPETPSLGPGDLPPGTPSLGLCDLPPEIIQRIAARAGLWVIELRETCRTLAAAVDLRLAAAAYSWTAAAMYGPAALEERLKTTPLTAHDADKALQRLTPGLATHPRLLASARWLTRQALQKQLMPLMVVAAKTHPSEAERMLRGVLRQFASRAPDEREIRLADLLSLGLHLSSRNGQCKLPDVTGLPLLLRCRIALLSAEPLPPVDAGVSASDACSYTDVLLRLGRRVNPSMMSLKTRIEIFLTGVVRSLGGGSFDSFEVEAAGIVRDMKSVPHQESLTSFVKALRLLASNPASKPLPHRTACRLRAVSMVAGGHDEVVWAICAANAQRCTPQCLIRLVNAAVSSNNLSALVTVCEWGVHQHTWEYVARVRLAHLLRAVTRRSDAVVPYLAWRQPPLRLLSILTPNAQYFCELLRIGMPLASITLYNAAPHSQLRMALAAGAECRAQTLGSRSFRCAFMLGVLVDSTLWASMDWEWVVRLCVAERDAELVDTIRMAEQITRHAGPLLATTLAALGYNPPRAEAHEFVDKVLAAPPADTHHQALYLILLYLRFAPDVAEKRARLLKNNWTVPLSMARSIAAPHQAIAKIMREAAL